MVAVNRLALVPFDDVYALPVFRRVKRSRSSVWLGRMLLVFFFLTPPGLMFIPWQQTVTGRGSVIAFKQEEREQEITSRINGQIARWYVKETDAVKKGQKIVELVDNNPRLLDDMKQQRQDLRKRKKKLEDAVEKQEQIVGFQEKRLVADIEEKRADVEIARVNDKVLKQRLAAEKALEKAQKLTVDRFEKMFKGTETTPGGLIPELELANSVAQLERTRANIAAIEEEILRNNYSIANAENRLIRAKAEGETLIDTARTAALNTEANILSIDREIVDLDIRIQKQEAQVIFAPADGTIKRIYTDAASEGQYVKEGQKLAVFVPDVSKDSPLYVELFVDGVDAPLLTRDEETGRYPHVRLQFEGWPALQFQGWPSVSVGTFGGRIVRIDPSRDQQGKFRVLIEPEQYFGDRDKWPDREHLLQGNQAIGWVMLKQVSLGYELWRRLNGFPIVVSNTEPKNGKGEKE